MSKWSEFEKEKRREARQAERAIAAAESIDKLRKMGWDVVAEKDRWIVTMPGSHPAIVRDVNQLRRYALGAN